MKTLITAAFLFVTIGITAQNVGIDVTVPTGKLHIKSNSGLNSPQLRLTEDGHDYARLKYESTSDPGAYWDIAAKADTIMDDAKLNFYFRNATNSGDRLTILGNGNVGINSTSPLAKLDIRNTGEGAELLRLSTERPWVFKQSSTSLLTRLTLQSTIDDKVFEIVSPDPEIVTAAFRANTITPAAYLIPTIGRLGVGTYTPNARMAVEGSPTTNENVVRINVNYQGSTDIAGVDCDSYPAEGYGVGANFRAGYRGLRGIASSGSSNRLTIGVVGAATGTGNIGTRVGLWGNAFGGLTNWAGYFDEGNVYVKNQLHIGSGAIDGATGYKVAVDGKIIAEEVRVQLSGVWPDYVFDSEYTLTPLAQLEEQIQTLGHLPGIPSAEVVERDGILLGDMQKMLLEKIEELTLHIIALEKEVHALKNTDHKE